MMSCESGVYRRADCRFTRMASADAVELGQAPAFVNLLQHLTTRALEKYECTRTTLLLERVYGALAAPAPIIPQQLPGLLRDLCTSFIVHVRASMPPDNISAISGVPTTLVILTAMIAVLDRVLPCQADSASSPSQVQAEGIEAAKPQATAAVLREVCGPHGFIPECVECLTGYLHTRLRAAGAVVCVAEFEIHALMAMRLALASSPAVGEAKLCDPSTVKSIQAAAAKVLERQVSDIQSPDDCAPGGAELALDVLRLALQHGGNAGKTRWSSFRPGSRRSVQNCDADGSEQLAAYVELALRALERNPKNEVPPPTAAAVRLLATLADTSRGLFVGHTPQQVAAGVARAVVDEPRTPQLVAAVCELACHSKASRSAANWLPSRSPELSAELVRALLSEDIPRKVAQAASKFIRERCADDNERLSTASALLDDVEAIFGALPLRSQDVDCLAELRSQCASFHGEAGSETGSEMTASRHSLTRSLSNLRQSARKLVRKSV